MECDLPTGQLPPAGTQLPALQVVGNLQRPQSDHAARVAQFAIQAVHAANSIPILEDDPGSGTVSIRAGEQSSNAMSGQPGNSLESDRPGARRPADRTWWALL